MLRVGEYILFFVTMMLLQLFLFNNLNLSLYIYPLAYVAIIALLPMDSSAILVLIVGLATGVIMDAATGVAGLNTIASLFTAFVRKPVLLLTVGKENVRDGGIPNAANLGAGKFIKYCIVLVLIHCFVYFVFESLSWSHFHLTLLRICLSGAMTMALVYFSQMLLLSSYSHKSKRRR